MGGVIEEHACCHVATSVRWRADAHASDQPRRAPSRRRDTGAKTRRAFVRPERKGFPRYARRFAALTPGSLRLEGDQEGRWPSQFTPTSAPPGFEMRHLVTPSGARRYSAVGLDAQISDEDPPSPSGPGGSVSRRRS